MSVSEGFKKYFNKNYYVKIIGDNKEVQKLKIQPWTMVYELKMKISNIYKFSVNYKNIRLFYCNIEMLNNNNMLDYKIFDFKSNIVIKKFIYCNKKREDIYFAS